MVKNCFVFANPEGVPRQRNASIFRRKQAARERRSLMPLCRLDIDENDFECSESAGNVCGLLHGDP